VATIPDIDVLVMAINLLAVPGESAMAAEAILVRPDAEKLSVTEPAWPERASPLNVAVPLLSVSTLDVPESV
jgi:hypothetical protein